MTATLDAPASDNPFADLMLSVGTPDSSTKDYGPFSDLVAAGDPAPQTAKAASESIPSPNQLIGGGTADAPAFQKVGQNFSDVPRGVAVSTTDYGPFSDLVEKPLPPITNYAEQFGIFGDLVPKVAPETEKAVMDVPGERPPLAMKIAGWIDEFANKVTGGRSGATTLQDLVSGGTREPLPGEPSFTNAGIPTIPQQEGKVAQAAAGVANVPIGFANFLLSGGGLATVKSLGMAPKLIRTLIGAGFTAEQAHEFVNAKTMQEKVTSGIGTLLLGAGTAVDALTGKPTPETPTSPAEASGASPVSLEQRLPLASEEVPPASEATPISTTAAESAATSQPGETGGEITPTAASSQGGAAVPTLKPGEEQGTMPTGDVKTEAQLAADKSAELDRLLKLQQAQDVRVGAAKPLRAGQDIRPAQDMFAPETQGDIFERRKAEDEMVADLRQHQTSTGDELLPAIEKAGGLPGPDTKVGEQFRGELQNIVEMAKGGRHVGVKGVFQGKLFNRLSRGVDSLVSDLRAAGFNQLETPDDLFKALDTRLRTGQEVFGFGPGAAATGEFPPQRTTSTKNAITDTERLNRGLQPIMREAKQSNPSTFDMAEVRLWQNPEYGKQVVSGLLEGTKRDVSEVDEAVLLHEKISTMNERDMAAERALDMNSAEEDRAQARVAFDQHEAHLNNIDQATHRSGTIWGRLGQFRQRLMRDDFTFEAMERRARIEKGEPLTPEESATIKTQSAEIQAATTEAEKAETARVQGQAETAATEAVGVIKSRVAKEKPFTPGQVQTEFTGIVEGLETRVKEGDRPTDLRRLIQKLAENFVRRGVTERDALVDAVHGEVVKIVPELTRRQTMDLISGYGDVKLLNPDQVKAQLRDIKGQLQQVGKIEDMLAKQPPKKTGLERRTPSDEERRLIKQVNELKKKGGFVVTDPAKQLRSALDAIKTRLRNQISDLDHQIATKTKIVKTKTSVPLDAEAEALRKQRDELKTRFEEIFGKPEMTDEQRLKLATAAVERGIAEYERRIAAGDFTQKTSRTPVTPALEALRKQRDDLRGQFKLLEAAAHPERALETALRVYRAGLERRTADLERRMREKDFAPKAKRPPLVLDKPTTDALFKAQKVKDAYNRQLFQWKLDQRSMPAKVVGSVRDVLNTARSIKTSIDLSAVRRQGGFIGAGHPLRAASSFMPMIRAFGSEKAHFRVMEEIKRRENYPLYQSSKLYISDIHEMNLSKLEENYMTRWADKIPLVAGSQRAYVTFLNKLRADSFDAMAKTFTRDGTPPTKEQARAISNYVNVATGRGEMGAHATSAVTLNTAFFAPRYVLSRFQLLAGQPFYKGTAGTRMLIAREYTRSLIGLGTFLSLGALAGGIVILDRRSTDYGHIRFGNTHVDPLTGLAQVVTMLSRVKSGETMTAAGDIVPIRGPDVPFRGQTVGDVIWRFVRSKLSPATGTAFDIAEGRNIAGQPVTPLSATLNFVAPMNPQDVYQAMVEQGVPAGIALGLLSTLGDGVNTYDRKQNDQTLSRPVLSRPTLNR